MKKDFIWNTLGYGLYCFIYAILLVIITRISGLETAGIFSVMYATANIIYQLALYGGKTYHVTDKNGKKDSGTYFATRIFSAVISVIIVLILSIVFKYNLNNAIIFFMLCLTKIIDAISDFFHGFLQINKKLYLVGISLLFKTTISIIVFGIILYLTNSLLLATISLAVIALLTLLLFDYPKTRDISKIKYDFNKEKFKLIIKDCFYLFCGNIISSYLVNIPKYILVNFGTEKEQGIFAILIMPAFVVATLASFVVQPFLVDLTESFENDIKLYKKKVLNLCKLIFLIFVFVLIIGCLIGLPIMSFIFNTDLNSYKIELIIVISSSLLYTISVFICTNLTLLRKIGVLLYLNMVVAFAGNIISYFVIKYFGLIGSYISFFFIVTIQVVLFTIYYMLQLRKLSINNEMT